MNGIRSLTSAQQSPDMSADEIFALNAKVIDHIGNLKTLGTRFATVDGSVYKYNIIFKDEPKYVYGYPDQVACITFHLQTTDKFNYPGVIATTFTQGDKFVYLVQ